MGKGWEMEVGHTGTLLYWHTGTGWPHWHTGTLAMALVAHCLGTLAEKLGMG